MKFISSFIVIITFKESKYACPVCCYWCWGGTHASQASLSTVSHLDCGVPQIKTDILQSQSSPAQCVCPRSRPTSCNHSPAQPSVCASDQDRHLAITVQPSPVCVPQIKTDILQSQSSPVTQCDLTPVSDIKDTKTVSDLSCESLAAPGRHLEYK